MTAQMPGSDGDNQSATTDRVMFRPVASRPLFAVGEEVQQVASGEIGQINRVLRSVSGLVYHVMFPSGPQRLPPSALRRLYPDPFVLLSRAPIVDPYDAWLRREATRLMFAYHNDPI